MGSRPFHNGHMWKISNTVFKNMFIFLLFVSKENALFFLFSTLSSAHVAQDKKVLFELITHSKVIVERMYYAICCVSINHQSTVHDVLFRFVFSTGWHWVARVATSHNDSWWCAVIWKFTRPLQHGCFRTWCWELPLPSPRGHSLGDAVNSLCNSLW